MNIYQI